MNIEIKYQGSLPKDKVVLPKSADINCDEYKNFLPIMQGFIEKHQWKFASSMPKCPHFYVCRDWLKDQDEIAEFNNVLRFIQKYGYDEKWFNATHRYMDVGEYKYWTMGCHWEKTIIINRALKETLPK